MKDIRTSCRTEFANAENNTATHIFTGVAYGEYAIVVIHDENNNRNFDLDKAGIPKEGVSFYKNEPVTGNEWVFDRVKFIFSEPEQEITMRMTYPGDLPNK